MILRNILLVVLLSCFYSSLKAECTAETIGLCTPGVTTETSTTETVETIITNIDSGDLLDGDNGFVTTTKEGDMDSDWGGKGSASMPTGSYCNELGTDRCAEITSSTLTTFYQEIDISSLDITNGGRTNYTIKVDKQDSQDRIYMKIHGNNGNEQIFTGTDVLSETGVTSGYQLYSGGFDFGGVLNTITIEIGGQDINLSVGVLFDDVSINVLYNVVNTIVTQHIQNMEEFLTLDYEQDVNDVAEMIFENNEVNDDFNFEPIEKPMDEFSFETVETEMQEFEMEFEMEMDMNMDYDIPMDMPTTVTIMPDGSMEMDMPMEMTMASVEMEMEMDIQMEVDIETTEEPTMDMPKTVDNEPDMEANMDSEPNESQEMEAPEEDVGESKLEKPEPEPEQEEETEEPEPEKVEQEAEETEAEPTESEPEPEEEIEEPKEEPKKEPTAKQKAATKIVKNMGDKGRYEEGNQIKTLIVMQVLGNTKTFFESNIILQDVEGFFTNESLPDTMIPTNNMAQYFLFGGSNSLMDQLVDSQYK
jgi:hypothetical protein